MQYIYKSKATYRCSILTTRGTYNEIQNNKYLQSNFLHK